MIDVLSESNLNNNRYEEITKILSKNSEQKLCVFCSNEKEILKCSKK